MDFTEPCEPKNRHGFCSLSIMHNVPDDFGAFIAERSAISYEQADHLIQIWLTRYRPRIRHRIQLGAEAKDEPERARDRASSAGAVTSIRAAMPPVEND